MRSFFAAGCVAAVLSTPSSASAWADASVRALDASLETQEGGATHMALEIDVEVHGGWLTEIEVPSLGEGVVLDAQKPAWAVLPDGRKLVPDTTVGGDGSLRFRFPRTNAPHRGRVTLGASLDMTLPGNGETLRFEPPMWQSGLDGVRVRWSVPANRRFVEASGGDSPEDVRVVRAGDRQVLEAYRPHLPRGVAWAFEFAVGEPSEHRIVTSPATFDDSKWPYLALFLFVLAIGAAKRATTKSHVALFGLPTSALVATAIGLAGASLALDELRTTLFLVALGLAVSAFASKNHGSRLFDGSRVLGVCTWLATSGLGVAYALSAGTPHLRLLGAALPLLLAPLFYAKGGATSLKASPEVAPSAA